MVEKINWLETPQMLPTNDPLLNAKKCWTRAGPNFLPLGWAKKQLCNQFLNTITRSKVAWLSTDIPFLRPVLNYKLPWNWFKRVINDKSTEFLPLSQNWKVLDGVLHYKWALILSSRTLNFSLIHIVINRLFFYNCLVLR